MTATTVEDRVGFHGMEITPIFVSVKEAAKMLRITPWSIYRLLDQGVIISQYHGGRRLVRLDSLREYADNLPTTAPIEAS